MTEEVLGGEAVSPYIFDKFMAGIPILNSERVTYMDMWVSYFGYRFDLNFSAGLRYLRERDMDMVRRLAGRVAYTNPEAARQIALVCRKADAFLRQ